MTTTHLMTPARPGLADLLDGIREQTRRGLDPRRTALAVADVLRGGMPGPTCSPTRSDAATPTSWSATSCHAEPAFSVKALIWQPGQRTSIHDHIAWCAFGVMQGVEYETLYRDDGDHLTEIGRVANQVGDVSGFAPPGDIHRVHNTGDVTAISLHVYGADLSDSAVTIRREYDLPVR